jgi:hypothetical protein
MTEELTDLERAVAKIDYLMNEGVRIGHAELDKLKALAATLTGVVAAYETPLFKLLKKD